MSLSIIGFVKVDREYGAVETHRDTYMIDNLTVVSSRKPLLVPAVFAAVATTGFAYQFSPLLYADEKLYLTAAGIAALVIGSQVGLLTFISRDLRNLEQSAAVWGWAPRLNQIRKEIVAAIGARRKGGV